MRIREVEKAIAVLYAAAGVPLPLENPTFFVEVGPPSFNLDDFVVRRSVRVNGVELGSVSVERVQDDVATLEK